MTRYVDFRKIKKRVPILDVAGRYQLPLSEHGASYVGDCPLCSYASIGDADPESRKFKINPMIGAFKCFGCGAGGNAIDLVAKREKTTIQRAAVLIAEWFDIADCDIDRPTRAVSRNQESQGIADDGDPIGDAVRDNEPLDWEGLKSLSFDHDLLLENGLDSSRLEEFGAGYCSRGMMSGRLACPIRNREGELLGYCGVSLDGKEPRVKFPPPARFERGLEFFNLDRALVSNQLKTTQSLLIVEDVLEVFLLGDQGQDNVIATMEGVPTRQQVLRLRRDLATQPTGFHLLFVWSKLEPELRDVIALLADGFYVGFVTAKSQGSLA